MLTRMASVKLSFLLASTILALAGAEDIFLTDYLTQKCNSKLSRISGRIETSTALTYDNLMDCSMTITASAGKNIQIMFKRFEVEEPLLSTCVDAFNMYDGSSTSAAKLHTGELCGFKENLAMFRTTGNSFTIHFKTDGNAVYRGFEIIYTEFTFAPCTGTDFACDNGICIVGDLECDDISQCGDESDEANCSEEDLEEKEDGLDIGLIIGCVIGGLVFLIIIAIVIYKVYEYYKWKRWIELNAYQHGREDLYQYPVTDKYNIHDIGVKGRRAPEMSQYFAGHINGKDNKAYLDEA